MAVASQRIRDAFVFHHYKGDAIGQRPILVGPLTEQLNPALKQLWCRRNDFGVWRITKCFKQSEECAAIFW